MVILLLFSPTIEHVWRGGVVTMLGTAFLSCFRLLRARWIWPTIQTAPIFTLSSHRVISIHHYRHCDEQGQASSSGCPEDRRGNHILPLFLSHFSLDFSSFLNRCRQLDSLQPEIWKRLVPLERKRKLPRLVSLDRTRCHVILSLFFLLEIRWHYCNRNILHF